MSSKKIRLSGRGLCKNILNYFVTDLPEKRRCIRMLFGKLEEGKTYESITSKGDRCPGKR
jgi:hypothetical protein